MKVLLVSVLSTPCCAGQVQTRTVAGRVIDYQARPVEGALVVCYGLEPVIDQYNIWDRWKANKYEPLGCMSTKSDGRFSFRVAATEGFSPRVVAGKDGLALGWCHYTHSSELTNTIRLGKPSLFKGTVVDEVGHPVSGARVSICLRNRMMAEHTETDYLDPESWFISHTDVDGQFVFDNIPKGATADFEVMAPGKAALWTFCGSGLDAGEQFYAGQTDIHIELPAESRLSGQVVDELTGRALAGIKILARPNNSAVRYDYHCPDPVKTDTGGRFELAGLAPAKYQLEAIFDQTRTACLTVTLEAGQIMRNVNIPLSRGIPFEVAVYDLEQENPIEDADVSVTQKPAESRYETFSQTVITDANGLARLRVPPGECEVRVYKSGYGGMFEAQRVQLNPGKMLRHEISLPRSACILSGKIVDEQGQPLEDASVMQMMFGLRTITDAEGRFDTSHIGYFTSRLPSKVRVLARHVSSGLGGVGTLKDPDKCGRPRGRISLKPAYTLTGRITDPDGRNIPAAYVKLLQRRYRTLFTEVATNADGIYSIRSVPPPEGNDLQYVIAVCAEGFGLTQVSRIPFHEDTTKPVHIEPIILLPADHVISGVVQDSNGQPVADALVRIYGPRLSTTVGMPPCGKTLTDSQGRFRVEGMCREPLEIYAQSQSKKRQTGTTWAHGGNENVKVVLGQKLQFIPLLIGKPLPELKDFGINLSPVNANGKAILVCFFDMNQRPSRNCLRQLSERAQELSSKDIVVVAVQSSKIDENKLKQWVKKYNIPFTVGMVRGDAEKNKFDWGVRSLPWLILTDDKRVVRAEGLALAELDEKLKANK